MIGALIAWLTGGGALRILDRLTDARQALQSAQTDQARIAAQTQIAAIEAELQAQRETAVFRRQTAGQWEMRLLVLVAGLPPAVHFGAVCLVSMFPGWGWTVQRLPAPMDEWQGSIILSLFGLAMGKAVAAVIARRS